MENEEELRERIKFLEDQVRKLQGAHRGMRKRSSQMVLGMPLYDIAVGPDPDNDEVRGHARGFIAIGDIATGIIAIGGIARGIAAVGGVAFGLFCLGGCSLGILVGVGGLATGLLALGGLAIGGIAIGGGAIAFGAIGGFYLHNTRLMEQKQERTRHAA